MKIETHEQGQENILIGMLSFVLALLVFGSLASISPYVFGGDFDENDTATAQVNVTNVAPIISDMRLWANGSNPLGTNGTLELSPGTTTLIYCNASIYDTNGYLDLNHTNATLFHQTSSNLGADNQEDHYTNGTCTRKWGSGLYSNWLCSFRVWYFALNGTWTCNMTTADQNISNEWNVNTSHVTATMSKLVALNVTEIIDYGKMNPLSNSSADEVANIGNLGNVNIDVNIWGYARDATNGDNASMVCDVGNISVEYQHYNLTTSGQDWNWTGSAMQNLSGVPTGTDHDDFTLAKATTSAGSAQDTYWRIGIPQGIRGRCNGTIVFGAYESPD